MSKSELQLGLERLRDDMGFEIRSYSGRGMYGKNCLAIVCYSNDIYPIMFALGQGDTDHNIYYEIIQGTRSDNMGLSNVYYWPRVGYVESDDDKEDDEYVVDDE